MADRRPARRSAGEGSVFRLPDGRYRAQIDLPPLEGRRRRLTAERRTRREALAWLREAHEKQRAGQLVTEKTTVSRWVEVYLAEVAAPSVRPSTLSGYARALRSHVVPTLGRARLTELTPAHVSRLYAAKRQAGVTDWNLRQIHASLRRCLNVAMRYGLVNRNVVLMVDPPRAPDHEVDPLTPDEARRLLAAAAAHRLGARWAVGLTLGLRQGEVLGLWWSDIDLHGGDLRVSRQYLRKRARPDPGTLFGPVKSRRSRRTLTMPPSLVAALRQHQKDQDRERSEAVLWKDPRLVFATPTGTPIDHSADSREFKRLLAAAGIRRVRLHDLRHTAASLLLAEGVHPRVVMEMLGHSQIGLTMNTYSHVMPSALSAVADTMERSLYGIPDAAESSAAEDA